MLTAALAFLAASAPQTLELSRGATIQALSGGPAYRYWAVEDTVLDPTRDTYQGALPILYAGKNETILIQFKDLNRALGPFKKITKATLVLAITDGANMQLESISKLLRPWTEGGGRSIAMASSNIPNAEAERWAATWRHRRAGGEPVSWGRPGAQGDADGAKLQNVTTRVDGDQVFIEGLASSVQEQYERWYDNHGFALRFRAPVEFLSSNATEGNPKLVLEVEDVAPSRGPDLSVTYIERTPEYPRYDTSQVVVREQNGHRAGVVEQVPNLNEKHWPNENEELTYTAKIKNVGNAPANGFIAQWIVKENPGTTVEVADTIQPGQEAQVTIKLPFKSTHTDHRMQPLALKLTPKGPDAIAANNYLEVQQAALNLGIYVEQAAYDEFLKSPNMLGSQSFEDWIQEQFRIWNEVYFPHSRFSFAPNGVMERVRIQRITVVPDGSLKGESNTPTGEPNLMLDGEWGLTAASYDAAKVQAILPHQDTELLRNLSLQIGLTNMDTMNVPASLPNGEGGKVKLMHMGQVVTRGRVDRFPGLMGGGDTQNEAALLPSFNVPYEPYKDPVAMAARLMPTDLYDATSVAALNANLGKRRGYRGEYLYDINQVVFSAVDFSGRPIPNAKLSFYQMSNGMIEDKPPVFELTLGPNGGGVLPSRETLSERPVQTATGHTLRPNPFGRIDSSGSNGVFLIKCEANGVTEWGWLKAWHLVDSYYRGLKGVTLYSVRFNVPDARLDPQTNLANGRPLTSSNNAAPAALAPLVDGTATEEVALGDKANDWIEIDLGRDRMIGEVSLVSKSPQFWQSFVIKTYQTGQKAEDAGDWVEELDWAWTLANRRDVDPQDHQVKSVAYRGPARRARFIRIISKSDSSGAKLAEIRVVPVATGG